MATTELRDAIFALLAAVFLLGCDDTRRDWGTCYTQDCGPGRVCTADHRCVSAIDAGVVDGGLADARANDAPEGIDGELAPVLLDGAVAAETPSVEVGDDVPVLVGGVDAGFDMAMEAGVGAVLDGGIDASAGVALDLAIDTRIPDAAGTCFSDGDCAGQAPFCVEGHCVPCKTSDQCQGGTPICSPGHACLSCAVAGGGCPSAAPACESDSGRCVECAGNDDCTVATKPICDSATNTCVACTSDAQCVAVGPGVCMFHLDGHCATDAETIRISSSVTNTCSDAAAGAGSALVPYCTVQRGVLAAKVKSKPLVVMAGALSGGFSGIEFDTLLSVVGKNAVITPEDLSDGIGIASGEIYLRGLTVAGSAARQTGIGINAQASAGATLVLRMESCTVTGNPGGGILLGGAAFDIRNSTISGNGPGQTAGGTSFGGIRVDRLPTTGPTSLDLVTITNNLAPGLSCAAGIQGHGVLASGNVVPDISYSCGVLACTVPSATCGAQP
jgi:hypothetical protein